MVKLYGCGRWNLYSKINVKAKLKIKIIYGEFENIKTLRLMLN